MRRTRKSRSRRTWSDAHQLQLASGYDWFDEAWTDHPSPESLAEMEIAWADCKDDIMTAHLERFPCTRPWAWWQFDAPEPRDRTVDEKEQLTRLCVVSGHEILRFQRLEQKREALAEMGVVE